MSDKLIAGLVTAAAIAPICAVCVLGPAAVGSSLAWVSGWFMGLDPVATTGLGIIAAIVVHGFFRRRRGRLATGSSVPGEVQEAAPAGSRAHESPRPDVAGGATGGRGPRLPSSIRRVA
jgi:hypothetical protein